MKPGLSHVEKGLQGCFTLLSGAVEFERCIRYSKLHHIKYSHAEQMDEIDLH